MDELEAFGESFNEMITDFGCGSAAGDRLLPIDPHRSDEFIGFDRLEVELNRRYRGPESKKHEFEREVHLRMRQEVQKQIVAKITMWLVTFITVMILATVFSEMNLPVVPNLFRYLCQTLSISKHLSYPWCTTLSLDLHKDFRLHCKINLT